MKIKHKTYKAAAFAAAALLCVNNLGAANTASNEIKNMVQYHWKENGMDRNKLNIGAYYLRPCTEKQIREFAECGLDFVVNFPYDREALDLLEKYHVGAIVSGIYPGWWGGNGDNAGKMSQLNPLEKYRESAVKLERHPAIWGVDTGDEPSALDFPYYDKVIRLSKQLFPEYFPYLNLYPNYASVAVNSSAQTINQLGTASYEEHIAEYCKNVSLDYLCYDFYMYSASVSGHYDNLLTVADACRKSGRSLWIVLQVNSSKKDIWITENQLRAQAYSALAFGQENITWACYVAGWWFNQVVDDNGDKTQQYEKLKKVNMELHKLGPEYMRFRNTDTGFVGFPADHPDLPVSAQNKVVSEFSNGVFQHLKAEKDGCLVVGQMVSKNADGSYALMVFPADDTHDTFNRRYSVTFRCDDKKVRQIGAEVNCLDDGSYSMNVVSNHGVLIIAE